MCVVYELVLNLFQIKMEMCMAGHSSKKRELIWNAAFGVSRKIKKPTT